MSCCRPSCGIAMLLVGAVMASGDLVRSAAVGWAMWVWILILLVVLAVSMFTVSPASPDHDTGEPPP